MPQKIGWKRQFASDTVAGICPQAMQSLQSANEVDFVPSYGEDDEFTDQARKQICQLFGKDDSDCRVFFVSSGTVANAVGTVMSRLFRSRKLLQRYLWDYAKEHGYVNTE